MYGGYSGNNSNYHYGAVSGNMMRGLQQQQQQRRVSVSTQGQVREYVPVPVPLPVSAEQQGQGGQQDLERRLRRMGKMKADVRRYDGGFI